MGVSPEVTRSLRILGLSPGASVSEVRSAFRRLARTCHPDVAGRQAARRFEQIAGAYTFLKGLSREELQEVAPPSTPNRKPETPWTWRKKRSDRLRTEGEQRGRAAREAGEKIRAAREARLENILRRGERDVDAILSRMEQETRDSDIRDLALRLSGDIVEVRHMALSRLGGLINRRELLGAVTDLLSKREIDEKTARLVSVLPMTPENRRKMAEALAEKASTMPDLLLAFLLQLRNPRETDRELRERYLRNATPDGVALILRHWPKDSFLSAATLRILMSREEDVVLIALLGAMKQRATACPPWGYERLKALGLHPNVAVRVWAKALLPD